MKLEQVERLLKEVSANPGKDNLAALIQASKKWKDHNLSVEIYFWMARIYLAAKNYETALETYLKTNDLCKVFHNDVIRAKTLTNIGVVYYLLGKFKWSMKYHLQSIEVKKRLNDVQGIAHSYVNIGSANLKLEKYIESIENFDKALQYYSKPVNNAQIISCILNKGIIYIQNQNFDFALECFMEIYTNKDAKKDLNIYIKTLMYIAEIQMHKKNFAEANRFLRLAMLYNRKYKNSFLQLITLSTQSTLKIKEGLYATAKKICCKIIEVQDAIHYEAHAISYMNLGIIALWENQLDKAFEYLKEADKISQKYILNEIKRDVKEQWVQYYLQKENYKKAFEAQTIFIRLKEEFQSKRFDVKLIENRHKSEREQMEQEALWQKQKNDELQIEKDRADNLLKNILPDEVAEELKNTGTSKAVYYEEVTVMFTDFFEFSRISMQLGAQELVAELHACFKKFDEIMEKYEIEKIKTVGDAYLAVCGLPTYQPDHAKTMLKAAIEIRDFIVARKKKLGDKTFNIRVGLHTGPVVAGIVGVKKFAYDIWGETVNTAARMEQNSEPGKINISETTYKIVKDEFHTKFRGEKDAKNIGKLKMYFVT